MNRLLLSTFVVLLSATSLRAQGSAGYYNAGSHNTSAVDAKGVRHTADSYRGAPPWLADRLSGPSPDYPMRERALRYEGQSIVRMTLDLKTGRVIKTLLLKSSGYPTLDQCALSAFSRWTWGPGRWREIDMAVTFQLGNPSRVPVRGATRLPPP